MPGANYSIRGCSSSRRSKGISIFNIPKKNLKFKEAEQEKWRNDMINIITRDREIDSDLRRQIIEDRLHICEKHFQPDEMYYCKFIFNLYWSLIIIYLIERISCCFMIDGYLFCDSQ